MMIDPVKSQKIFSNFDSKVANEQPNAVNVALRVLRSPAFLATLAIASVAVVGVVPKVITLIAPSISVSTLFYPVALSYGLITLGCLIYLKKPLIYDLSLTWTLLRDAKRWWNPIKASDNDESEYAILGGIPLKNWGHIELISQQAQAILTVLEPHELEMNGLWSEPVRTQEWVNKGLEVRVIAATDFCPVPVDKIEEGVQFIDQQRQMGRKVYVHCKAGKGRSATVVIAYLLRKGEFKNVQEAIDRVKKQRPIISINRRQRAAIEEYFVKYCKSNKGKEKATPVTE